MRATMIVYANPDKFRMLADDCRRFTGTRTSFFDRLHAAYLVFTGRADALSWSELPNNGERIWPAGSADRAGVPLAKD